MFMLANSCCRFHNSLEKSGGGEHSASDLSSDRILSNVDDALMMKASSWVLGLGGDPESHESKLASVWLGKPWQNHGYRPRLHSATNKRAAPQTGR